MEENTYKSGVVALFGRPNVGKSTLLNNILGHKVAITSPKAQTTRFPMRAVFTESRGQIIFLDTPGIFGRVKDPIARRINKTSEQAIQHDIDCALYVVDKTRTRDFEENKILGIVRKLDVPKILVINKTDVRKPDFKAQYRFIQDECIATVEVSALSHHNLNLLIDAIFEVLPVGQKSEEESVQHFAGLDTTSTQFVAEIIREKVFLFCRKEVPYSVTTEVETIEERKSGLMYIKGKIITSAERYKSMIIGKNGFMIKEIGMAVRKELEVASGKKMFIDLTVEVNPHWQESF